MGRKAKEGKIDLYYLNSNNETDKNKARAKHKDSPSKKSTKDNNDIFNFDDEIVIGLNIIPNQNKDNQNKKKQKSRNRSSKSKENRELNINERDRHERNYKKAKLIIRIFVLLALFIGVIIFLITSPIFNITTVNVVGNEKVSNEQIISLSQIQYDTNIYKILSSKIEDNVKENAYIDTVKVKRKIPNEINITITERKPQYMLKFGNAFVYINNQGYMLEISETKLELPIISGYSTEEENIKENNRLSSDDLRRLETVLRIMDSATYNEINKDISEIDISNENNYVLIFEEKGKIAYLGEGNNISDKIAVLKQMLIKAEGQKGKAFLKDKNNMYFREE